MNDVEAGLHYFDAIRSRGNWVRSSYPASVTSTRSSIRIPVQRGMWIPGSVATIMSGSSISRLARFRIGGKPHSTYSPITAFPFRHPIKLHGVLMTIGSG
jgi:hypothetical protein